MADSNGNRDIVVTGLGVICAAGQTPDQLWETVRRGPSPATWFASAALQPPPVAVCAIASALPQTPRVPSAHKLDRCVQLALAAAESACREARLADVNPDRLGIIAGTSRGPVGRLGEAFACQSEGRRMRPTLAAHTAVASLSGALSLAFGARGPCFTVSATCASSANAIALGAQQIAMGAVDGMLVGGAEAPLLPALLEQFRSAGILGHDPDPQRTCRPFDRTRDGTVLGEGAAFLVLESRSAAERRGAPVLARLAGWGIGADSHSRTGASESGEGLRRVTAQALAMAGLQPEQLDYINLHGTGTPLNDRIETVALRQLLGDHRSRVPCSATKPVTGHCLGASAALEAVICLRALRDQCVPPTLNLREPDPECDLDLVPGKARSRRLASVLSVSQGFWGNNAALVFTR